MPEETRTPATGEPAHGHHPRRTEPAASHRAQPCPRRAQGALSCTCLGADGKPGLDLTSEGCPASCWLCKIVISRTAKEKLLWHLPREAMLWDRTLARNCWAVVGRKELVLGRCLRARKAGHPRGRVQPHSLDLSLNCSERKEKRRKQMAKRGGSDRFWVLLSKMTLVNPRRAGRVAVILHP